MKLEVSTPYPDKSSLSFTGDEKSVLEIKKLLEGLPHLFIVFEDIEDLDDLKKMNITFPTFVSETIMFFVEDYVGSNVAD